MTDVVVFGEPLVAFYPVNESSIAEAASIFKTWGGDTSNVVLQVARLGHSSKYFSKVGDDPFGHGFLKLWKDNGVDTSLVKIDAKRYTGLYFASFEAGHWKPTYYRSASAASAISIENISSSVLADARALHVSGISIGMGRTALEVGKYLVDAAKGEKMIVSFDINYRPPQWSSPVEASDAITSVIGQGVDILEITNDEMLALGWGNDPGSLFRRFPKSGIIVYKQGASGATILTKDRTYSVPAFPIQVKDTVGAGDSFDAAFLISILDKKPIEQSARFAAAAAALTCTGTGPLERMPCLEEVNAFLEAHSFDGARA